MDDGGFPLPQRVGVMAVTSMYFRRLCSPGAVHNFMKSRLGNGPWKHFIFFQIQSLSHQPSGDGMVFSLARNLPIGQFNGL